MPLLSHYPSPPSRQTTLGLALLMPRGLKQNDHGIYRYSTVLFTCLSSPFSLSTCIHLQHLCDVAKLGIPFGAFTYESKKKKTRAYTMGQFEETKLKLHLHLIKSQIFKHQFCLLWVGNQAHESLSARQHHI